MPFRPLSVRAGAPLWAAVVFAQLTGVAPRPNAADYPAHTGNAAVALGATFLNGTDQQKLLGKDWSSNYLILEVALYPEPNNPLNVSPREFMLRTGSESFAPVDAETLAPLPKSMSGPPPTSADPSKVHVRTIDSVGVYSGPDGHKGVYTDSQVQVAVGDNPWPATAPPPPRDPRYEERGSLEQHELADTKTERSIAGYLYFPKPKHAARNAAYELAFYGEAGQLRLTLHR